MKKVLYTIVIFLSLLMIGCSQKQPIETPAQVQQTTTPSDPLNEYRTLFNQGIEAMKDGELKQAQKIMQTLTGLAPHLSGPYLNLALIHYSQGQPEKALPLVNKALEVNPQQAQAYQLRAQIYLKQGKIHPAKQDYQSALELNPSYSNAQYNLALLYDIYLQDIAQAILHYEQYLELIDTPDEATADWVKHLKSTLKNG